MTRLASERTFLTPAEVAKKLRVGLSTVYRAIDEGRLPARKVLGRWRVDDAELSRWIDSHPVPQPRQQVVPPPPRRRDRGSNFAARVEEMRRRQASEGR